MVEVDPSPATPPRVFDFVGQPAPGATSRVWLRTDLDLAAVPDARAELAYFLTTGEPAEGEAFGRILIHLGAAVFVDLHGLRLLIEVTAQVRTGGGELHLLDPPRCVRVMVRVLQLHDVLSLLDHAQPAPDGVHTATTGTHPTSHDAGDRVDGAW